MVEKVFYTDAKYAVVNFVSKEFPGMPEKLLIRLYSFFYKFCNYEEENQKVRPSLIITNNIDFLIKNIPTAYKLEIYNDKTETLFESHIKSLTSFCKDEWSIFICIKDEQIIYGICKTFNSIKEKSLEQLVFETDALLNSKSFNMFLVNAISSYAIELKGIKGNNMQVNFSLTENSVIDYDGVITRFVEASLSKLKTTKKKLDEIKILQENIFKRAFKNLHGTICIIIDKDYVDTGLFSDGTWLQTPIDLSKIFIQTKSYSEAKLNNIAELFMSMLNYDGITIMDNSGKIRAYNVFVSVDSNTQKKIVGGARKRAAYSIINSKRKKIIGVYFQSQDGEIFYQEVNK